MKDFSALKPFDPASILVVVPRTPGLYLIYDQSGPIYGGRSKDLSRRLREHVHQRGSVKIAALIQAGEPLRFSFLPMDIAEIRDAEATLVAQLGLTQYANIVHAGLYKDEVGHDPTFDKRNRR
jgi:hypothetical protein